MYRIYNVYIRKNNVNYLHIREKTMLNRDSVINRYFFSLFYDSKLILYFTVTLI